MSEPTGILGWKSGVGLVAANMIGTGVFLSTGFMAQTMGWKSILAAWVFGTAIAMMGALAYSALATRIGRSGGEYRYLSDGLSPTLGVLAGLCSVVVGFAGPVAIDAIAVAAFADTLFNVPDVRLLGTGLILAITGVHTLNLSASKGSQNVLVVVKLALLFGFIGVGLTLGSWAVPTWEPTNGGSGFPTRSFFENQFWIAFAFSGWNAAIYAAAEFREPKRDVPKAMLVGCLGVGVLYLLINWVFVANLTPEQASVVFQYEETRITLGHEVASNLLGPMGGVLMSVFVCIAFTSAMSAMTLVGPRVASEMARDGFLPSFLAGRDGEPPRNAIFLQSGIALLFLWTQTLLDIVESVGVVLMVFSALTAASLILRSIRADEEPLHPGFIAAAVGYILGVTTILFVGFPSKPLPIVIITSTLVVALVSIFRAKRRRPAVTPPVERG